MTIHGRTALMAQHRWLRDWALTSAAPLWSARGIDHERGGFVERLDHNGEELPVPRRARLVARQIYSFATLERLGRETAGDGVDHGLDALLTGFVSDDGEVIPERTADGALVRRGHDLYDVAFVLFALAAAAASGRDVARFSALAVAILTRNEQYRHVSGGFVATDERILPLEANPHMHMMEAALAWAAVPGSDDRWDALADEVASLCLRHFIDPLTGRLREFYGADWRPVADDSGRIVEPGHQFEWAWLLERWGRARGRADALSAAEQLVRAAEREGVNAQGIAFNALNDDGSERDRNARLWPQTERIKGWIAVANMALNDAGRSQAEERIAAAIEGLRFFLNTRVPGLWYETIAANGVPLEQEVRASSLYHILCALDEVERYVARSA